MTIEEESRSKTINRMNRATIIFLTIALSACHADLQKTTSEEFRQEIHGEAQGTTWSIVYYDLQERNLKPAVDSLLARLDESLSTYLPGSIIDEWNKSDSGAYIDQVFLELLLLSYDAYLVSVGSFDPTVKPLVSYWGFGPERFQHPEIVDQKAIDSMLTLVNFDTLKIRQDDGLYQLSEQDEIRSLTGEVFLVKSIPGMQLDFNAVGQGWSVDLVVEHLRSLDLKVLFVEIGGEIVAGDPKPNGDLWKFGIDKPVDLNTEREIQAKINLRNKGLATSGSYRKYYEKEGIRYSHTIDPTTGYPVTHSLLSATVIANDAATADAMATAFLVMGADSTVKFLNERDYLSNYVYLISSEADSYQTYTSHQIESLMEERVEN